ncbi:MAG: hypothetical protein JW973_08905 [Bacteroidales bacterium]|nr:hypothetical protein [Bacteroidales bacterium]
MKTFTIVNSGLTKIILTLAAVFLLAGNVFLFSQEGRSVINADVPTRFVWGLELKTASIQDEYGTQCGAYAGALFNNSLMAGMVGALNVTHPAVNYGYLGFMARYIYKPNSIIHMSGQLTLGAGSTRDYQNDKTSTFDNFGNVYGTAFYFVEPAINSEINLGKKVTLVIGLGYRLATGINTGSPYISSTHVNDRDLSGFTVSAGVEFGLQ